MPQFLKKVDLYGRDIPSFSMQGETRVSTSMGGIMTLIIVYVTFLYATLKFQHLVERNNPQVVQWKKNDVLHDEVFHVDEDKFMMAFAIEDFVTYDSKTDPRYLKWQTVYLEVKDGVTITEREIDTYPCTEGDYKRFK